MDRIALEARVEELASEHTGSDFVVAIERFAADLDSPSRTLLEQVLLERSTDSFREAIAARVESKGWFRRQLDKADEGRPPRG